MKLLETRMAPNPRRVRIFLAEKGIQVPTEELDLMKGDLKSDNFTKLNKLQRVPVLVLDDGTALCESIAICRYFEELHPEPALFGKGALGKAQVEMWQRRIELGLLASVASAFRHLHPAMAPLEVPQVAAWGEANKPKAQEMLKLLDEQLAGNRYITGDSYSVADITALVAMDFMRVARVQRPEGLANLERWYGEVSTRPSAKA
ncbi:MAG: glutathione S-transferase [Hyphomicrobium sp.]|nr:glutathione S-transferase [Hyphomicrobium sp.]MBN9263174.1 glutathione S-transferase [Hyphomicrobium sp.]